MKESISNLRTTFRKEMRTKLDVIQTRQEQVNTGLKDLQLMQKYCSQIRQKSVLEPPMHISQVFNAD
jgi:L-lactate utilization protein LutB